MSNNADLIGLTVYSAGSKDMKEDHINNIDSAKTLGKIWSDKRGWHYLPFPDVPARSLALCVHSEIPGLSDWEIEDKLIELGFNPSYRHLGLNNPRDDQDPTSLVFFIRKHRRDDPALDAAILTLIKGGIPPRAIWTLSHKVYCAVMQLPMDRNDSSDDD